MFTAVSENIKMYYTQQQQQQQPFYSFKKNTKEKKWNDTVFVPRINKHTVAQKQFAVQWQYHVMFTNKNDIVLSMLFHCLHVFSASCMNRASASSIYHDP